MRGTYKASLGDANGVVGACRLRQGQIIATEQREITTADWVASADVSLVKQFFSINLDTGNSKNESTKRVCLPKIRC